MNPSYKVELNFNLTLFNFMLSSEFKKIIIGAKSIIKNRFEY